VKVIATEKPSWNVRVVNEEHDPDSPLHLLCELALDKADAGRDRIDLVCWRNGEVVAIRGHVADGLEALNPEVPAVPEGTKVIAMVNVRGATKYIDDIDITNYGDGVLVTGEVPAIPDDEKRYETLFLDGADAFDALLIPLVHLNRVKRHDYANDVNIFANFDKNVEMMNLPGYTAVEDALSMVTRKIGRITNLRGKDPANETVLDSYKDLAVYAVLLWGLAVREAEGGI
jgi:hypothetical protein